MRQDIITSAEVVLFKERWGQDQRTQQLDMLPPIH